MFGGFSGRAFLTNLPMSHTDRRNYSPKQPREMDSHLQSLCPQIVEKFNTECQFSLKNGVFDSNGCVASHLCEEWRPLFKFLEIATSLAPMTLSEHDDLPGLGRSEGVKTHKIRSGGKAVSIKHVSVQSRPFPIFFKDGDLASEYVEYRQSHE